MTDIAKTFSVGSATVKIIQDQDAESPVDRDDKSVIFASLDRRSTLKPDWANEPSDITDYAKKNKFWEIPLFKYEHSGVIYRVGEVNPFSCPWDSGRVGSILLAKSEWPRKAKAIKYATVFCQEVTDWCNGNVWGYTVETPDGEQGDACWGYIGDCDAPYLIEEATDSAKHAAEKYDTKAAREAEATRPDMYAS